VPGDLALVGFYDTPWCQATATPLSSVKIDLDKMADAVVSRLLLPPGEGHTTLVHPELVARASSTK